MAHIQPPHESVGETPVNNSSIPPKAKKVFCILCRKTYSKHEAQEHMHSMLHHRELETVLGKDSFHECQACKVSSMGLNEYAQHISTSEHKGKLKRLMSKNVKPRSLMKTLSTEAVDRILERNKMLKREQRKAAKKKRKKLKQIAVLKHAEMLQEAARKNTTVKTEMSKWKANSVVTQNKENKVLSLQRTPYQRESAMESQMGRFAPLPGGQAQHHPSVQGQFTQSPNNKCSAQRDRFVRQHDYYSRQYNSGTDSDFTNDHFPHGLNGAIIFDHSQNESPPSQPGQESPHCSTQPANKSVSAAPIRDIDVSTMLRQIRRALGVREPCRADREARRQNSEAGVRVSDQAGAEKVQKAFRSGATHGLTSAAATSLQPRWADSPAHASSSGVVPSGVVPARPTHTAVKMTQGRTQYCEKSSVVTSESNGPSNSRVGVSQGAISSQTLLSQFSGRTASSVPSLYIPRKVRIAHKPLYRGREAGLKPTLNKLLISSGAKTKLSWREMYEEMRRKKQERATGRPRFGIVMVNPQSDQGSSTQAENIDLPLSEGFHWESFQDSSPGVQLTGPPPPPQNPTYNGPRTETRSDPQIQKPVEKPAAVQESCSRPAVEAVSVTVEPKLDNQSEDLTDSTSANKRKHKESTGQKKKTKTNKTQDQMDRLLAVSLREDELSHSLQNLDQSLLQARNALQVVYTEVQRLLLLRQQCTAEVNCLRAKRIEILQGMQGCYSGSSNAADKVATFSAGSAAQPSLSPLPTSSAFPTSSNQHLPPSNAVTSISQSHPAPLAVPVKALKQEICQMPAVTCNPDTPPIPVNQPYHLLPSLLFTSPQLAAPVTAVTSHKQTNSSPESCARQQDQGTTERLKDYVKTVSLATEDVQVVDSEEETGGNLSKQPAAETPASTFTLERGQNASAPATNSDGGSESDASVKMLEPPIPVVINIDESDNEESVSDAPILLESPQRSVSVELSCVSTQTFQQTDVAERKVKPTPVKDECVPPPECVWVVEDEEPAMGAFMNHSGPVHALQIHEGLLYTCSGDNTARAYSLKTKECVAVFEGHTNKVNCLLVASLPNMPARLYTGSSDETIRCYSMKSKKCLEQIYLLDRVLCLHIAWNILFAGLANGSVASYDSKTLKQLDMFDCHGPRGVSCLGTAQEGARRVLLVGSYDSTISVRDAKSGLLLRSLAGHKKTVLCIKVVNDLVFSSSSDTSVHAHNIHTGELIRVYKGHGHAVTSIAILGKIMLTACLDELVRVYDLQSHDRLQVYGGHSDMVMCMAVHNSVIYTGCYDGSVQAVNLNLMKNYRCWWQNCSLVFGMAEHLVHHLVADHTNPNLQTVKCRWRGCSAFFKKQESVRQELPEHMKSHVEDDSELQP